MILLRHAFYAIQICYPLVKELGDAETVLSRRQWTIYQTKSHLSLAIYHSVFSDVYIHYLCDKPLSQVSFP